jgi:transcription initiation factor TFIIE subunit alpha
MDKDEATQRQERQEEAEAKRQQNLMPAWHLKSTISGDLTALGIAESARTVDAAAANGPSSNEDILRSLGSARTLQRQPEQRIEVQEDIKPVISQAQQEHDCEWSF